MPIFRPYSETVAAVACGTCRFLKRGLNIPVSNEAHTDYAWEVAKQLRDRGIRVEVDERNEKMQYKIRASQTQKIPYQLIVGDKEMEDGTVNVRRYGQKQTHTEVVSEFVENILADIARKSRPDAE